MRVYFYSSKTNINSYFLVNEGEKNRETDNKEFAKKEGLLLDPTHINEHFIEKIENEGVLLKMVLLTNARHPKILHGVNTLKKVYHFQNFCSQNFPTSQIGFEKSPQSSIYTDDGFEIVAYPVKMKGHDVCMYKIGTTLFTGLPFLSGFMLPSNPSFLEKIERERLKEFLFSLKESTFCFPLSGPPFTIKTFKFYANN